VVLMMQMLVMCLAASGGVAGVSGHDLPTAAVVAGRSREPLLPTGFRHVAPASTSLLVEATSTEEREGTGVEVKIGITDSPRELVFTSSQTPSEVEAQVSAVLGKDSDVLGLTDDKGRRFLVHSTKIAYVEIGAADSRRVGFGIGSSAAKSG
jgi:hypothetical protein